MHHTTWTPLLAGFGWVWRERGVAREWRLGGERDWGVYTLLSFCPSPVLTAAVFLHDHSSCPEASPVALALAGPGNPLSPLVFSGLVVIIVSAVDNRWCFTSSGWFLDPSTSL